MSTFFSLLVSTALIAASIASPAILKLYTSSGEVYTVTTIADTFDGACDADCSLRDAITAANAAPGSLVQVPAGVYLIGSFLQITQDVTVQGAGMDVTIIDGGDLTTTLIINAPSSLVFINDLTIRRSTGSALASQSTTLELNRVRLSESENTMIGGGGLLVGSGFVQVNDSVIDANEVRYVTEGGGGVYNVGGQVTLYRTTVTGNFAPNGGGIYKASVTLVTRESRIVGNEAIARGGGIFDYFGTVTVQDSEISGNQAGGDGGGIFSRVSIVIEQSTISGNSTHGCGGGIGLGGTLVLATISHSTIVNNWTDHIVGGAGICGNFDQNYLVNHTILADNIAPNALASVDCSFWGPGGAFSGGYNLVETPGFCGHFGSGAGDIVGIDPEINALANNGGFTQTHALAPGGPAVDSGDPLYTSTSFDQRGAGFPRLNHYRIDIGAYELQQHFIFLPINLINIP